MFKMTVTRKRKKNLPKRISGPSKVKFGFPSGTEAANVMKAYFNEFGTAGSGKGFKTPRGGGFGGPIPERPFMRNTMRNKRASYQAAMRRAAVKILRGEMSMLQVLQQFGIKGVGDIQAEITSLSSPPNSPLTIALKGSAKPLVDTGNMAGSVTHEVFD